MRFMIFDRWGNPLGDLPDAISAIRTQATDGTDTLDITALGEIGKDERIVFQDTLGQWNEYICQGSDVKRASGIPVTIAYAANSITELSRTYIEDKRNRDTTAKACLDKALENTRWQAGTVDAGTLAQTANLAFYHCTVLEAIQSIADTYGLEVQTEIQPTDDMNRIGRRIIHMLDRRGQTNPTRRFEYGKDLPEISRTIDTGDVITRLYGWGKGIETTDANGQATGGYGRKIDFSSVNNGKKYVEDPTATQQWGIPDANGTRQPSVADIDFTDCDDPQKLLDLTKAKLKTLTTPTVSYTATVKALQQAGLGPEGTGLGDETQITDTTFTPPLRLQGRILKTEEDLLAPLADTKITLGNIRQSYTQRLSAQQQALDKLVSNSGAWNDAATGTGPYMRDLIDRINQIMNETGGYAYMKPGTGILVYDRPEDQNPTQAIQIGGGYWRIADKKNPTANGTGARSPTATASTPTPSTPACSTTPPTSTTGTSTPENSASAPAPPSAARPWTPSPKPKPTPHNKPPSTPPNAPPTTPTSPNSTKPNNTHNNKPTKRSPPRRRTPAARRPRPSRPQRRRRRPTWTPWTRP